MQDVRLRLWRSTTASCRDAMLAPPKGVALGNGRAGASGFRQFPGAVALLNACGLIRRTTLHCWTRENTLLPQCKIVRDKQQTGRHQVLSDRAKNYFSIFESVPKDGLVISLDDDKGSVIGPKMRKDTIG